MRVVMMRHKERDNGKLLLSRHCRHNRSVRLPLPRQEPLPIAVESCLATPSGHREEEVVNITLERNTKVEKISGKYSGVSGKW